MKSVTLVFEWRIESPSLYVYPCKHKHKKTGISFSILCAEYNYVYFTPLFFVPRVQKFILYEFSNFGQRNCGWILYSVVHHGRVKTSLRLLCEKNGFISMGCCSMERMKLVTWSGYEIEKKWPTLITSRWTPLRRKQTETLNFDELLCGFSMNIKWFKILITDYKTFEVLSNWLWMFYVGQCTLMVNWKETEPVVSFLRLLTLYF